MKIIQAFWVVATLTLAGCVTRPPALLPVSQPIVTGAAVKPEVGSLRLSLSEGARGHLQNNPGFNQTQLELALRTELDRRKLLQAGSSQVLDVLVTDLRVRHGAAIWFAGPFSGKDYVVAEVSVMDAAGQVLKRANINVAFRSLSIDKISTDSRNALMQELFTRRVAAVIDPSIPVD